MGLRIEQVVIDHLALGALVEYRAFQRNDEWNADRDRFVDVALSIRVFTGIELTRDVELRLHVALPVGFTAGNVDAPIEDTGFGVNTGGLAGVGVAYGVASLFVEGGYRFQILFGESDDGLDYELRLGQFALNVGLTLQL